MNTTPYWETLCKNKEELKLLNELRRTKVGHFVEVIYSEEFKDDRDTFTEILYRIGYYIGNWEEYYDLGETEDAGIRLSHIRTAKRWLAKAERYCEYAGYKLEKPYY